MIIKTTTKLKAIAAINNLGYIGKDGKLMWKSSEDFKHFKAMTKGAICIVGKTTYEIDLGGKGLPGRDIIVIGENYHTIWQAIHKAILLQDLNDDKRDIWIIGGKMIYEQFMPFIDEFHLSIINDNGIGDRTLDLKNISPEKIIKYKFEVD